MSKCAFVRYLEKTVVIVLSGIVLCSATNVFSQEKRPQRTVNAVALKKQSVEVTNQYVGYVVPIKSVDMVPNVSGYVDEVWAEGGKTVKIGDNLVLIDQREYKAEADLAKAEFEKAKADFNNAKSYYQRIKKAGTKAVAPAVIDEAKAKFLAAEAGLKQAEAALKKANVVLDYTVLQAPIDGVVGEISLTKGDYVAPNMNKLFSIVQYDPIRVKFAISDKEYLAEIKQNGSNNLFKNENITLKLANGETYPIKGQFKYLDNQLNKSTNSVSVFVDFENKDKMLAANSYVDVVVGKTLKDVFLIRQNYVTIDEKEAFVYIIKKGKIRKVALDIGGYFGDYYAVFNKFLPDEFLVVDKIGTPDSTEKFGMKIVSQAQGA